MHNTPPDTAHVLILPPLLYGAAFVIGLLMQPAGKVPHRGRDAHQRGVRQPLLVQCFQESRGYGDKPLGWPIMLGERLVEGEKGVAELLRCLPV